MAWLTHRTPSSWCRGFVEVAVLVRSNWEEQSQQRSVRTSAAPERTEADRTVAVVVASALDTDPVAVASVLDTNRRMAAAVGIVRHVDTSASASLELE